MRKRTLGREIALQFLYMIDLRRGDGMDQLADFLDGNAKEKEVSEFARKLVEGVGAEREELDRRIRAVAQNWNLERMATIDRNILRMATYEMLRCPDVPHKVSINEAIDLGKKYSTEHSGAFINGVLDKIRVEVEGQPTS